MFYVLLLKLQWVFDISCPCFQTVAALKDTLANGGYEIIKHWMQNISFSEKEKRKGKKRIIRTDETKNNGGQKIIKLCKQTKMFLDVFHAPNQMQSIKAVILYINIKNLHSWSFLSLSIIVIKLLTNCVTKLIFLRLCHNIDVHDAISLVKKNIM